MIRNIIFDLGNVLISFRPSEYFEKKGYPENLRSRILEDIFGSSEWIMLDKGEITTSEAIESISRKSTLKREEIARIFDLRTDLMFPLDQNVKLLPELKKRGYRLFFLSNFPADIWDEIRNGYYFFGYFEGGLISGEAGWSKPDSRIYEIFFKRFGLSPGECLYIDDIEANVRAAESFGSKGLVTYGMLGIGEEVEKAIMA